MLLEHEEKIYPIMCIEKCINTYYRVCVLIYFIINVLHFIIKFFRNYSVMCENKPVINVAAVLLAATGFCIYEVKPKVGHHSEIKSESPCEKGYKRCYLNGGDCYHIVDKDIVACNCTWLYGGERCEKYIWWT